jgi:hypothetical protein
MNALGLVLAVKIIVTIIFVAVPFLLLPQEKLRARFRTEGAGSGTLFRLYGVAMLAILANYAYGLWAAMHGQFPWGVIAMGVISNGGAVLVSLRMGAWRRAKALCRGRDRAFARSALPTPSPDASLVAGRRTKTITASGRRL